MNNKTPARRDPDSQDDPLDQDAQFLYDLLRYHLSPIWSVNESDIDIPEGYDQDTDSADVDFYENENPDSNSYHNPYGTSVDWNELR